MDVTAPPVDDTAQLVDLQPEDDTVDDDAPTDPEPVADPGPAVTGRRRRRRPRRLLSRVTLPAGTLELGVYTTVIFVVWWTTRSWVVAGVTAVAWPAFTGAARAVSRRRRASVAQRRITRERLTAAAVIVFVVVSGLAGLRAWSTRFPHVPKADPPNGYLTVAGTVESAWQQMYGRPATVRTVNQVAASYWNVVVEDEQGCWLQSIVLRATPLVAGERTPVPCPAPTYAPTQHGDRVDPAKSAPARVAVDFVDAWLTEGDWAVYTAPGSRIRPLDRAVKATGLAVYPIAVSDKAATVWVTGQAEDGPVGVQLGLVDDKGRWFVAAVAGSPPVDGTITRPLPTTSTTSPTTTTTTGK